MSDIGPIDKNTKETQGKLPDPSKDPGKKPASKKQMGAFFSKFGFSKNDCKMFMVSIEKAVTSQIEHDQKQSHKTAQKIKSEIRGGE